METHTAPVRFLLTFVAVSAVFVMIALTVDGNLGADSLPGILGAGVPLGLLSVVRPQWVRGRIKR
jgi:hypothetical protein